MNNQGRPPNTLPFYVASYGGRKVTIKRDPDYQACVYELELIGNGADNLLLPGHD